MLPNRSRRVVGSILCEARPHHLPRPGKIGPVYTTKTVHEIEASPKDEVVESWYFREMRTGAADLRLLEAYFRAFHEQRYGNSMDAGEDDLCDLGREIASEIGKLAERVEDAVGPAPEA